MSYTRARFFNEDLFHAELVEGYERPFIVRRPRFKCRFEDGFFFRDENDTLWRPSVREYFSDGATVPYPLALIPPFTPYRYKLPTMAIHDPACEHEELEQFDHGDLVWKVVRVPRSLADELLRQGVKALGAWKATQFGYWAGVRAGAGCSRIWSAIGGGHKHKE
jgi:hypothetical protein